jgi:phosphatidylinositol phospholipase C delta
MCRYTRQNFGRVYPFGLRFDSSNADPMLSWSHGCQLAALNLQGKDRAAWLAHGFFLSNGNCGYVKKPQLFLQEKPLPYEEILKLPPKLVLKVSAKNLRFLTVASSVIFPELFGFFLVISFDVDLFM